MKQLNPVYYVLYTTSIIYEQESPVYIWLIDGGHMIQGSIYDATKYESFDDAVEEVIITRKIFKNRKFEIIPIDRRIFGAIPRNVISTEILCSDTTETCNYECPAYSRCSHKIKLISSKNSV